MRYRVRLLAFAFSFPVYCAAASDSIRVSNLGVLEVSAEHPAGAAILLSANDSALIILEKDTRFFTGVEFEITAPAAWTVRHNGVLTAAFYSTLERIPSINSGDVQGKELRMEPLPAKIKSVYQIPIKQAHGLKANPYVSLLRDPVPPDEFPVLFKLTSGSGGGEEAEALEFRLHVKPLFSDEGAVRIFLRYPDHLQDKPVAVLIDGKVIENPAQERLLKEGEHHLTALSADYRNQSRRFVVERGKALSVTLAMQDLTPQMIFEAPANARIFLDDKLLQNTAGSLAVEAGKHDVKIQVSDYSIIRSINVQKGKTYRISFMVDMAISEHE